MIWICTIGPIVFSLGYYKASKYNDICNISKLKLFKHIYYLVLAFGIVSTLIYPTTIDRTREMEQYGITTTDTIISGLTLSLAIMEGSFGIIDHIFKKNI
ncbi:hypothetical protein K1514_15615 [Paraclostridium bifermentans]|uniref:hypothetical protein n=1 Tax=Paraclostridium TaxID=1849822 RepID=UPI001CC75571|nr:MULTISPECIES: hypothetical protein [Paraclostridium]MBZ6007320.1 hypothetical protein [Paraclostridium bifermentans]MDU0295469.1 hypothetical protein [Paraclostridium sp. MRS3W1]